MKNIFEKSVTDEVIARIEKLSPETQPQWGKMGVAQMFAHLSVADNVAFSLKMKGVDASARQASKRDAGTCRSHKPFRPHA